MVRRCKQQCNSGIQLYEPAGFYARFDLKQVSELKMGGWIHFSLLPSKSYIIRNYD